MKTAMIYYSRSILEIALNSLLVSTQSYKREVYSLLEVLATNKFCLKLSDFSGGKEDAVLLEPLYNT